MSSTATKLKFRHRILPQGLFGRFLLIILAPSLLAQAVAIYIFYDRHWSGISQYLADAVAGEVALVVRQASETEPWRRSFAINEVRELPLRVSFAPEATLHPSPEKTDDFDTLNDKLARLVLFPYQISYLTGRSEVAIDVQFSDGVLHIITSRKRLANPSTYIFIMWMTGTTLFLLLVSVLFMRTQVRSIRRLSDAAENFGKGMPVDDFKPQGAAEVRKAGEIFLEMKERIDRQVSQRTEMLAGVSHDLRTPLTRMKLQLSMMPGSADAEELQSDITEMEKMIHDYLEFAKGNEDARHELVNVTDLLRSIIAGYRHQHRTINLKGSSGIVISASSNALRRVLTNLIDNALRFGKEVDIHAALTDKKAILMVDDDGPGIPEKKRQEVFKPFYRLDHSRNAETGGSGLGLAIAKDIVVGYGGDISLEQSPKGGLRVIVKLPL